MHQYLVLGRYNQLRFQGVFYLLEKFLLYFFYLLWKVIHLDLDLLITNLHSLQ